MTPSSRAPTPRGRDQESGREDRGRTPFGTVPEPFGTALEWSKVDFPPEMPVPSTGRWALASLLAIVGSLVADAILVAIGTALFPSTKGFVHFQFADYAKLTVIGVVFACIGWPIVTAISSRARWLFFRLAILVTGVLLLPDLYLLLKGEAARAVFVLVWMHLAIAVVTYNALVRLAPPSRRLRPGATATSAT